MLQRNRRIKRRVVRELVAQNLDLIRGRPPGIGRRSPRLRFAARLLVFALVPVGLAAPSYLSSPEWGAGAPSPPPTAEPPEIPEPAVGRGPVPSQRFDAAIFPLAVERVAIDPGHGGSSGGTRTPSGLLEKDITLDIANRLRRLLEGASFEVVMTREADDDVSLENRTRRANEARADLFVSLHVNWIANRGVRGVETYYLGPTDDPFLTQLAAAENRGSGYSLTDLRTLLEQIYVGVRQEESQRLAETVQGALLGSLRAINPKVENRGVKTAPFIVLMKTEMPAILAEVSCLSNEHEAELLAKPLYRQFLAEAVFAGIRAYSEALKNPDLKGMNS